MKFQEFQIALRSMIIYTFSVMNEHHFTLLVRDTIAYLTALQKPTSTNICIQFKRRAKFCLGLVSRGVD